MKVSLVAMLASGCHLGALQIANLDATRKHQKSMSNWSTVLRPLQVQADFIRVELGLGATFANIALSTDRKEKRIRNLKKAMQAYTTVLMFVSRVALSDEQRIGVGHQIEALRHRLVALGEMGEKVLGRRLDDRIRRLAVIAENFAYDSPVRQTITEKIKNEMSEYFEREKNPQYDADHRSKGAWGF